MTRPQAAHAIMHWSGDEALLLVELMKCGKVMMQHVQWYRVGKSNPPEINREKGYLLPT